MHSMAMTASIPADKKQTMILFFILFGSLIIRFIFIPYANLLPEEAYYWNYSLHPDFGYLDHPPMVAFLIKISTFLAGNSEFAVRLASPICWMGTVFFSYRLTECIQKGAGIYAAFLLSILPFFFLHSLVITPDLPLILCWSAALFYLYQAICLKRSRHWYMAGIWCGLGLLSKYSMVLIGLATFLVVVMQSNDRKWLTRKEPWLALLIAFLIFTPVIYWNINHEWVSFAFQGNRRFQAPLEFSLHEFIGLACFFLTPAGLVSIFRLKKTTYIQSDTQRFFLYFALTPFIFFGFFSITHPIKFNWIGPALLAFIPIFAVQIYNHQSLKKIWFAMGTIIMGTYAFLLLVFCLETPQMLHTYLFRKFIGWNTFTVRMHDVLKDMEKTSGITPIIIPFDLYNISSEMNYYQTRLFEDRKINKIYPVIGQHVFGNPSLMYQYWSSKEELTGKPVLLIGRKRYLLEQDMLKERLINQSPIMTYRSQSQLKGTELTPYYFLSGIMR